MEVHQPESVCGQVLSTPDDSIVTPSNGIIDQMYHCILILLDLTPSRQPWHHVEVMLPPVLCHVTYHVQWVSCTEQCGVAGQQQSFHDHFWRLPAGAEPDP